MANEFIIKNGFHSKGNSEITGSLTVSTSITATSDITASGNISSSGNIIANQIDTTQIIGNSSQVTLGYAGDNQIILEAGGDFFLNALGGGIEAVTQTNTQLLIDNTIQLKGSGSSPGITVATPSITLHQPVTASSSISASAFIGDGSGLTNLQFDQLQIVLNSQMFS